MGVWPEPTDWQSFRAVVSRFLQETITVTATGAAGGRHRLCAGLALRRSPLCLPKRCAGPRAGAPLLLSDGCSVSLPLLVVAGQRGSPCGCVAMVCLIARWAS